VRSQDIQLTVDCQSAYAARVPSKQEPTESWNRFALTIFDVNSLIMRAGEGISRPAGQSSARWQVLGRAYEPQTVAKMARDMGNARQSVQRVADVLEAEGLVVYTDHPTDRRTKLVGLTPRGMEALEAIDVRLKDWSRRVMTKLNPAELVAVVNALQEIAHTLEVEIERGDST
jgi:DNA-binding MarR family transcriptional regulator